MSSATMTNSEKQKLEHKDNNALITNSTSEIFIVYGLR